MRSPRRDRFPPIPGKGLCRGCGNAVPKGRRTWCSYDCEKKHHPQLVINAVWERDGHKCVMCGEALTRQFYWNSETNKPWNKPEFDHVIPFCEGGKTVLENMRTLCHDCHTKRTAAWHAERAKKRHEAIRQESMQQELTLAPSRRSPALAPNADEVT